MNAFERLSNLVDEIVILCETSEKETQQIRQKTEEYKEYTFFMFCTSLAPYWEMIKKIGRGVTVKTGVKLSEDECKIVFQPCYISIEYRNCNKGYVTRNNNDFYSYNQIANKKLFFDIAKNIDWNIFDKSFAEEVEKALTIRAALANKNKADALQNLDKAKGE